MAYETMYFSRTSGGFNAEDGDSLDFDPSGSISFYGAAKATTFFCAITGGITSATTSGRTHGAKLDIEINGNWRKIWEGDVYLPARGTTGYEVAISGTIPAEYQAEAAKYGVTDIRLRQTESSEGNNFALRGANASGYIEIDYVTVTLGYPTNVSATQTETQIKVSWSHASYNGSGTRSYSLLASCGALWEGYYSFGSGYTGTSADIDIQDSWRGKTINIWVIAFATDAPNSDGCWSSTYATITPTVLGVIRYCSNGTWVECIPYYGTGGQWKECVPYYCYGGVWKEVN